MVSFQELSLQQQKKERAERLRLARQRGAELGKATARHYTEEKRRQQAQVEHDLRQMYLKEQEEKMSQTSSVLFEVERRRGEGMRSAAAFVERQRDEALQENSAWDAEKELERHRFKNSLERQQLHRQAEQIPLQELKARKAYARSLEEKRSQSIIRRSKLSAGSSPTDANDLLFAPQARAAVQGAATLHTRNAADESAVAEANRIETQRRLAQERQKQQLEYRQEAAKLRAQKAMEEEREAQEKIRLEKEQEAALRAKLLEDTFRRGPATVQIDYQEQESRRATNLSRRMHLEFEQTFLQGEWKDAMRSHQPPSEASGLAWSPGQQKPSSHQPEYTSHFTLRSRALNTIPIAPEQLPSHQQQNAAGEVGLNDDHPPQERQVSPEPSPRPTAAVPEPIEGGEDFDEGQEYEVEGDYYNEDDEQQQGEEEDDDDGYDEALQLPRLQPHHHVEVTTPHLDPEDYSLDPSTIMEQRMELRRQHEKYMNDLNQLRDRIAQSTLQIAAGESASVMHNRSAERGNRTSAVDHRPPLYPSNVSPQRQGKSHNARRGDDPDMSLSPMSSPEKGTS